MDGYWFINIIYYKIFMCIERMIIKIERLLNLEVILTIKLLNILSIKLEHSFELY
jgi:hypothetical protein